MAPNTLSTVGEFIDEKDYVFVCGWQFQVHQISLQFFHEVFLSIVEHPFSVLRSVLSVHSMLTHRFKQTVDFAISLKDEGEFCTHHLKP